MAVCDHPRLPEARNIRSAIIVNSVAKHTWLVVPLYNEAQVVREVIEHARTVFPNIVCVDDGSSDDSVAEARAGGATVVQHPFNLGQGAALRTGLDYALGQPGAEYFVTFDSDGQHRVDDALAMAERLATGTVDVVVGSRFLDDRTQPGALKKLVLKTAVLFENLSTGVKLTDAHNGLRAFNRTAADEDPHRAEPHGARVGDRRGDRAAQAEVRRDARACRVHRVFEVEGPVDLELRQHPQRSVFQVGPMDNQLVIKIILIALFVVFGIVLVLPGTGARRLAIRRILLLLTTLAAVVAIVFPELVNELANLVGVGRGTDLILYVLVVVFIGNSISNSIRHRQLEREVTKLARTLALAAALPPAPPEPEQSEGGGKPEAAAP